MTPALPNKRSATPVDMIVGNNITRFRKQRHWSQGELGAQVGLSGQQIQKYERGANQISASRLQQFSGVLQTAIQNFFDDAPTTPAAGTRTHLTSAERTLIGKIINRLKQIDKEENRPLSRDAYEVIRISLGMCHMDACPLDLFKLLNANKATFGHDVFGIDKFMCRQTTKLLDHFLPHCALPDSKIEGAALS